MNEDLAMIAARVREMREICGYTPEEIASDLGIDADVYKNYEKTGVDIPISVLYSLAAKFGVDFTDLLIGKSPLLDTYCLVRKGEGINIDRYPGYHFQSLAYKFIHRRMEPLLVTLEPGKKPDSVTHGGQEFNLVIEGSMAFIYDGREIVMNAGDSVYFDATHPHGQACASEQPAVFLTIIME